ncbi:hypothetical protein PUN28_020896 [Cardiocondyla obscurior]|uniref:Uncharacterized protein n=1 Tax=Cardiocondyla obscurior TaxID=286306 RepID=A0AAW2E5K0_9HYME
MPYNSMLVNFKNILFRFLAISRLLMKKISPNAFILNSAQCYVVKFQKYFFLFFGHISAAGENRRLGIGPYASFLIAAQCYVAPNRPECIYFECRTMLCCKILKTFFFVFWPYLGSGENRRLGISPYASFLTKFQKYFFLFFGHISAAGENRRLGIGPNASILNAAQCYVAKFKKYFFLFFGHISAACENRRLGIGPYASSLNAAQCYVAKFQKYFLSFFGHISAAGENRKLGIVRMHLLLVAHNATLQNFKNIFYCFLAISRLLKTRNSPTCIYFYAAQCYVAKFQKYFISFFGHISASGENRRLGIGSYALFLIVAQCYVVKFQKYFYRFWPYLGFW